MADSHSSVTRAAILFTLNLFAFQLRAHERHSIQLKMIYIEFDAVIQIDRNWIEMV